MTSITPENQALENEKFLELFEEQLSSLNLQQGSIVKGTIIDVKDDYVVVDAGLKSESIIPIFEFAQGKEGQPEVQVGDVYDLFLESAENGFGETCLSREKAQKAVEWKAIEEAFESGESIKGVITDRVKGGFGIMVHSVKGFLPGSQVDVRPVKHLDSFVNQEMEFKIVKLDYKRSNIVVSRRAILEDQGSEERTKLLESLAVGKVVEGVVKNLTDYGCFVDLGGIDGLLHITDMSWKRVKHPSDLVKIGDEISVKVLSFDKEKNRVSLGLKQMQEDPWEDLIATYPVGSKVFGKVTNLTEYGCFVEIGSAIEGLVHMSEMDWTNRNVSPNKVVKVGDEVEVMILDIDKNKRRISLGLKQCMPNPWEEFDNNYTKDDKIKGTIKTITDFGVFIGLHGGIDGLIHATDLSWTESGDNIIRSLKKGEEIEAVVLAIDSERERVSLGVKQLTSDPFADFCEENPKGTKITVTVLEKDSKNYIVKVNDKINGVIKLSDYDADKQVGDTLDAYVLLHESRNYMLPLGGTPPVAEKISHGGIKLPKAPKSSSLGDLIKEKLDEPGDDS
jgi:small subunit ribosomal protein S1